MATGSVVATAAAVLITSAADDSAALTVVGVPDGTADFQFIYDGIANQTLDGISGALNLDLTAFDSIAVTSTAANVVATARLTIWTSVTVQQSPILPLANGVTSFSFDDFGTLDLSDVQSIRLQLSGIDLLEPVAVTSIIAVPEPASGLLIALGLLGIGLARRR